MRGEVRAIAPLYTDLIYSGFDALPELGEEVYTKAFDLQLGGGAAAIPIMLSRMGLRPAGHFFRIGCDQPFGSLPPGREWVKAV